MIFTTLFQYDHVYCQQFIGNNKRWLTSVVIMVFAAFLSSSSVLGEKPKQLRVTPMTNGIYLYGESDRPDIVGKEYIIFETINNKTLGAFYLPRSEFSCFYGQFKGSRLNVTLIDALDRQKYHFTLSLNSHGLTASKQPMMGEPSYQSLDKISTNDRRILATCKLQLQKY
jgi:hypothetical protein